MSKDQEDTTPKIINITGKVKGSEEEHLLQSIYPIEALIRSMGVYLAKSLKDKNPIDIKSFQDVINAKVKGVDELKVLSFDPDQRAGELIALVSLVAAINKINTEEKPEHANFVPAWQKADQKKVIGEFTSKESWDGFMYEHVPGGTEDPKVEVAMIGVEIKSLMINPNKEKFSDINDLLEERMPKFSKNFQIDGSIALILVPPYKNDPSAKIEIDLKRATDNINKNVGNVVSAIVFIGVEDKGGTTEIYTITYLVHKDPKIVENNIDLVKLVRVPFCKLKNNSR